MADVYSQTGSIKTNLTTNTSVSVSPYSSNGSSLLRDELAKELTYYQTEVKVDPQLLMIMFY
jgi:hypothetical protein